MITGIISSVIAGALNGSFAAPMKKITFWEWENTWFVYAIFALFLLPLITVFISVPGISGIYAQADSLVILLTFLTGFLYGIGSVTFGLGLHLAGLSLGYSLMIGLIAVTGSFVPLLMLSPKSIVTTGGGILLIAMAIIVLGVFYCGKAGAMRAGTQEYCDNKVNKRGSFSLAILVCITSGIFSSMLNISLTIGLPIAELAEENLNGSFASFLAYNSVWAVTLLGAFIPYIIYCIYLFSRNRSFPKYIGKGKNFMLAALMGILWYSVISLYGAGASNLGKLGTTLGWLILMSFTVIVGNIWGWFTGEWKGAQQKAKKKMATGLTLLFISVALVAVAKFYL
jgi:L-rhamnose-H+ transport protein